MESPFTKLLWPLFVLSYFVGLLEVIESITHAASGESDCLVCGVCIIGMDQRSLDVDLVNN